MKAEISTEDYEFFLDHNNVIVKYVSKPHLKNINLRNLNIEIVGIKPSEDKNKPWILVIISKESIQKIQMQITKSLDVVGFYFKEYATAVAVQSFILQNLESPKQEEGLTCN
jgi:hypothetical protein